MEEYALASAEAAYKDTGNRCQWDLWPHKEDFMMEILLTGGIRNNPNFPAILAQRIPNGRPPPCT